MECAKSLGWNLYDGKDLVDLPRYALGKTIYRIPYSTTSNVAEFLDDSLKYGVEL